MMSDLLHVIRTTCRIRFIKSLGLFGVASDQDDAGTDDDTVGDAWDQQLVRLNIPIEKLCWLNAESADTARHHGS